MNVQRPSSPVASLPTANVSISHGTLSLEIIRDPSAFMALAPEWNALLARSPQAQNPMLTHEWFRAWWESFGDDKELMLLLVKSGGTLTGIAPFMRFSTRYHGVPIRLLSLITNDHTNRADFILADHTRECVDLVLDFLSSQSDSWDMAELRFLPADSPTVEAIRDRADRFGMVCGVKPCYQSPFIPLTGDWQSFYGRLDGHFRRNMKNREGRLGRLGAVEYEEYHPGHNPLSEFLQEMFVVGERSWKGVERTAIASTSSLRCFYSRLAELTLPKGWVSLHLLRVDGKPIAFHYSLKRDSTVYLLKPEYDSAYHTYAPGHQILKHVLQECFTRRLREFDFLGPDMAWKREWTDHLRAHVRVLLFHRSFRSRALRYCELRAKPVLKRSGFIQRVRSHETAD